MHSLFRPGVLLLLVTLSLAPGGGAQTPRRFSSLHTWEQLGPMPGGGPFVRGLQATTSAPSEVYAASSAGLLRSEDRGQSWSLYQPWPRESGVAPRLAIAPAQPDRMAIAWLEPLVQISHDGGSSWFEPLSPASWSGLSWIEYDPIDPDLLYVAASGGLWRSTDGGVHFDLLLDASLYSAPSCRRVLIDRNNRLRIYGYLGSAGLCVSEDGGSSWIVRPVPPSEHLGSSLAIDPRDGRRLMVGGTGHYLSEDAGVSWITLAGVSGFADAVAFDPLDANRLYLSSRTSGLAVSSDRGASWTISGGPAFQRLGGAPQALLVSLSHPGEVLFGYWGGIARSSDGGATFQRSNSGLEKYAVVSAIATVPGDPNHLVARSGGSAHVSLDGGLSWVESLGWEQVISSSIVADPFVPGRLYITGVHGDGGRLLRSDDGGLNFYIAWEDPARFLFNLAAHPTHANVLFGAGLGVVRSDNGGASFVDLGVPESWVWDVAVSPADPQVLYATATPEIYASHDGGATWARALSNPIATPSDVFPDPIDPDRAWVTAPGDGLYRTDDGGLHWTRMPSAYPWANAVLRPASHPEWLVVGSRQDWQCMASANLGTTAFQLGDSLPSPPQCLAATTSAIYAGTFGHGLWVLR